MNIWNKYRIGDCCEVTSSKRVFLADYVESGIPFYRSKEIAELQSCTPITTPLYISEEKYKDIKTKYGIPQKGDLLLTAIGATLGIPYLIKDNEPFYFKDGNLIWFKNFNPQLSSEYLYLWMVSSYGYDSMQNVAIGSAQKALTIAALKDIAIEIPPIEIQKKISCVLTAYDNLIENNNKRIRLLEQMAENLYKEWFVRFRFPGHEKAEFENGLPKGWKIDKFGKYADVKRGGSPRPIQDYLSEEGLNWLKISDVTSLSSPYVFQINEKIKKEGLKKTVYRKAGTLVLSNSATPGISKILCVDTCIHDGWLYFENSYFSNEFLNLFFQHERANILKFGNGAVFTNLKTDILKNYNMSIPPLKILDDFQEIIMPIYELLKVIVQKNQILARQRDLLLPRLMSGKLEVNI